MKNGVNLPDRVRRVYNFRRDTVKDTASGKVVTGVRRVLDGDIEALNRAAAAADASRRVA